MPTTIDRDDVARMLDAGAQLVEVLPGDEYERLHLRGAVSLPLAEIERAHETLEPRREVIVYCYDYQ